LCDRRESRQDWGQVAVSDARIYRSESIGSQEVLWLLGCWVVDDDERFHTLLTTEGWMFQLACSLF
jgi:hypothetical protein